MPRSKTGKKRPHPSPEVFAKAVQGVLNEGMSLRIAANVFNISKSALWNRIKKYKASEKTVFTYKPKYDVHRVFLDSEEQLLVEYIKKCSFLHYGLTVDSLRKLAYDFAKNNGVKYPSSWDKDKKAGEFWYRLFRQRHSTLTIRKPEGTSLSRATAFNKANVNKFFKNYEAALMKSDFSPARIWNLDETGVSTVQDLAKVIAVKGQKQVGGMTSAERGVNITLISAVNAAGNFLSPFFVFPRVHFKQHMLIGAPPGSDGAANPSGWSNEEMFTQYFDFFIAQTKPSKNDPILLVLDNVDSHITYPIIKKAKEVGIIMVTFHPHTSHRMQPLDRTVFGPFKTYYHRFVNDWMVTPGNHGKPLTIYDVAGIVGKAYPLAFTPNSIISGFNCTGLFPFNSQVFSDIDFLPSNVTDRPVGERQLDGASSNMPNQATDPESSHITTPGNSHPPSEAAEVPTISSSSQRSPTTVVTPEMIRPFPKAAPRKNSNQGRKKGKSMIVTNTPEKNERELAYIEKQKKKLQKTKNGSKKGQKRGKIAKKQLFAEISSDEGNDDLILSASDDEMDIEQEIEQEELERQFEKEAIGPGHYVLIRLAGKKTVKYFAAVVTEKVDSICYNVKYLKKVVSDARPIFVLYRPDEYEIEEDDIVLKLPPPQNIGSTGRIKLIFPVDFTGFNLG